MNYTFTVLHVKNIEEREGEKWRCREYLRKQRMREGNKERERDRQIDRERQKEKKREGERERKRQIDRERERERETEKKWQEMTNVWLRVIIISRGCTIFLNTTWWIF